MKLLKKTYPSRKSAKLKLAKQAEYFDANFGGYDGEDWVEEEALCDGTLRYLSQREQDTIAMPSVFDRPVIDDAPFAYSAIRKLALQADAAARVKKAAKEDTEGEAEEEQDTSLDLTWAEQQAITLKPLRTNRVWIFPGGPDMIQDMLTTAQQAVAKLQEIRLTKMHVLGTAWQHDVLNDVDSVFGQCGETSVEAFFQPVRSLVRAVGKMLPPGLRSYFFYPGNMAGHLHTYVLRIRCRALTNKSRRLHLPSSSTGSAFHRSRQGSPSTGGGSPGSQIPGRAELDLPRRMH